MSEPDAPVVPDAEEVGAVRASSPAVERLKEDLAALDRAYSPGHHGRWSARRRAELVDTALVSMFEAAAPTGDRAARMALAALGGYGRAALAPASDIDLVVLHDGTDIDAVGAVADAVLYPLWDAGFDVGHAVRTPVEAEQEARSRLDTFTSELEVRHLAGDTALTDETSSRVIAIARADPRVFAAQLRDAARDRRERYGSAAHLLEPELKEGAGGLRDIETVSWLERATGDRLEAVHLLRTSERHALDAAEEFLTKVRAALHIETGRKTDTLLLDHQPQIARLLGFQDEPRLIAVDGLMRAVFQHARQVSHIYDAVFERYLGEGISGSPNVEVPAVDTPDEILQALADTAEAGEVPSLWLLDRIETADLPEQIEWTAETGAGFLRVLRTGEFGVAALDALDRLGVLVRFIPEWAEVRCRPQRDPYHRFTVDTHLTEALSAMVRILLGGDSEDPMEREAVQEVADHDGLLLGALLHDIGKIGEGGHVDVGKRVAQDVLGRMGLPARTSELAGFMVAEHLLLPDTATRRDLSDEDLILGIAARIGSAERLAALYLLAKADAEATGPSAWTSWRQTLIRELVGKVQRAFDRGEMGTELAEQLTDRIGRLHDLLEGEPEREVERFVLGMPRGYFLTVEPARAARHFSTVSPPLGANEVRTATASGTQAGTYELLVVAVDRSGLLSWIAGALSLSGLSILTAQVFTTDDGVAIDLFDVEGAWEQEVGEERWRTFRRTLRGTLEGTVSIARRVEEKRRHYPPPRTDSPVTVAVDNAASDFFTVIEIGAPDRIGLLYDITSALADLQLDVHLAKVATYTGRVIDTFYVRDALGRKFETPGQIEEVEDVVQARLAPQVVPG
ncbi:MAG: HD domain-containing protein [Actinomycetota bacterium]|nr:HD domain-containing protein [Actinomycetota bacterium]